jgi:hypothetical protein
MPAFVDSVQAPSSASSGDERLSGLQPLAAGAPGRERFIPVSRYGLRAKLVERLKAGGADERLWRRALDCLAAWRHQEYRKRLLDLDTLDAATAGAANA